MLYKLLICLLAGTFAGIGTGFVGLSAAVFIAPMLVVFLKLPVFEAVGISLASDIFASAISAATYAKEGNLDLKRARVLMLCVVICTVLGSIAAFIITSVPIGNSVMGFWSIIAAFILGLDFLVPHKRIKSANYGGKLWLVIICGVYIGFICGFQGSGGGLMMLFTLAVVMAYDYRTAVGTSVFIMSITAFIGAMAHFLIYGRPDTFCLVVCVISTLAFARVAAVIANKMSVQKMEQTTGIFLAVTGIIMIIVKLLLVR